MHQFRIIAIIWSKILIFFAVVFVSWGSFDTGFAFDFLPKQSGTLGYLPYSVFDSIGASQQTARQLRINSFCERIDAEYKRIGWGESPCSQLPWTFSRISEKGIPLVYWEYNGLTVPVNVARQRPDETTLILGGVHPDEVTPIHLAFRFAQELFKNPQIFSNRRVIIAPLVNPDGFFVFPYKRTNSNGVDLNRNFATSDWWKKAQKYWAIRKKRDKRHFPGFAPQSEEGTRFQSDLLDHFDADKVISIHSPLGFLDYDGPGDTKVANLTKSEINARELAGLVSRSMNNYSIKDYSFFPGSLGNYSGNERSIPTVTLELQSTDPKRSGSYWRDFSAGLIAAVRYEFVKNVTVQLGSNEKVDKN